MGTFLPQKLFFSSFTCSCAARLLHHHLPGQLEAFLPGNMRRHLERWGSPCQLSVQGECVWMCPFSAGVREMQHLRSQHQQWPSNSHLQPLGGLGRLFWQTITLLMANFSMETFLCQVDFQIWTLLECFTYFTRTGATDFALLKHKQTKKVLKIILPVLEEEGNLEIQNQKCMFYLSWCSWTGHLRFCRLRDLLAGNSHAVSPGCAPTHTTPEQKFSCDCIHRLLQAMLGLGTLIEFKWTVLPMYCF